MATIVRLSTEDDIDSRTDERRLLVDDYTLHADDIDVVRVALSQQLRQCTAYAGDGPSVRAYYWIGEAWAIDRACRALGIED